MCFLPLEEDMAEASAKVSIAVVAAIRQPAKIAVLNIVFKIGRAHV